MPLQTPNDPLTIALAALAATLCDERRAQRFLDLTGIGTEELRSKADDPVVLAATIAFLEGHEPDLLSVAGQIGVTAGELIAVRRKLEERQGMS